MEDSPGAINLGIVPLFPLPSVVLFPRAVLPLHIFERRYKEMTDKALASDRRIAMALLKPGWEKDYYQHPPIEPVVCVGVILSWEKLPDGKFNFLLQGQARARIVRELDTKGTFRQAELQSLPEKPLMEIDLANERQRLASIFQEGNLSRTNLGRQMRQVLSSPMPTAEVADLIAFNFLENLPLKQSLLAECDILQRVHKIIHAIESIGPTYESALNRVLGDPSAN